MCYTFFGGFMKKRISFEEIVWIFVIGCVLGFGVETLWHLLKNHTLINKQGLLYGPFKPIYGFGAVLLTVILVPRKDKSYLTTFAWGVVLGTAFEYFCSLVQEILWGTYTWNYINFKFALGSRIYLPYCLLWGFLTVMWIKFIYPFIDYFLHKINPRLNQILVVGIVIFMIFNLTVTALAMDRFSKRANGIKPSNELQKLVDEKYNDEVMHRKFPKLKVYKKV